MPVAGCWRGWPGGGGDAAAADEDALAAAVEAALTAWPRDGVLARAAGAGRPGPFQPEAAIRSAHASRARTGRTPWKDIPGLYAVLNAHRPRRARGSRLLRWRLKPGAPRRPWRNGRRWRPCRRHRAISRSGPWVASWRVRRATGPPPNAWNVPPAWRAIPPRPLSCGVRCETAPPALSRQGPWATRATLIDPARGRGGTGRHAGFRFQWRKPWGFKSLRPHHPPRPA